jgi:hypothetical protein
MDSIPTPAGTTSLQLPSPSHHPYLFPVQAGLVQFGNVRSVLPDRVSRHRGFGDRLIEVALAFMRLSGGHHAPCRFRRSLK